MNRASKWIVLAAAGAACAPQVLWAQPLSQPGGWACGPSMMGWGAGWYGMILGPLIMIVILAALISVVVLLVRWVAGPWHSAEPPRHGPPARTPLDLLKERYARGELNKEEFEERRHVLGD